MHFSAYQRVTAKTIPALRRLRDALDAKSNDPVRLGR